MALKSYWKVPTVVVFGILIFDVGIPSSYGTFQESHQDQKGAEAEWPSQFIFITRFVHTCFHIILLMRSGEPSSQAMLL
jgi:hypothetical protein